ncbi:unnamed protein product [Schistocephalus solidus]|uniref:Uncharacterized protein n=1 Tax=Schistocephalus solidus TaxID=70667 RepID=A0A183SUN5_SCHSO|nr:unnamed protein product [Schistocephalus solidus]
MESRKDGGSISKARHSNEAVICPTIGIADHLGHQHVLPISPPDENIVQQLPAPRPTVHLRGLLPRRKKKFISRQFRTHPVLRSANADKPGAGFTVAGHQAGECSTSLDGDRKN